METHEDREACFRWVGTANATALRQLVGEHDAFVGVIRPRWINEFDGFFWTDAETLLAQDTINGWTEWKASTGIGSTTYFGRSKSDRPLLQETTATSSPQVLEYGTELLSINLCDHSAVMPWLLLRMEEAALEEKGYVRNDVGYGDVSAMEIEACL